MQLNRAPWDGAGRSRASSPAPELDGPRVRAGTEEGRALPAILGTRITHRTLDLLLDTDAESQAATEPVQPFTRHQHNPNCWMLDRSHERAQEGATIRVLANPCLPFGARRPPLLFSSSPVPA